jgi:hypothetical protein
MFDELVRVHTMRFSWDFVWRCSQMFHVVSQMFHVVSQMFDVVSQKSHGKNLIVWTGLYTYGMAGR